MSDKKNNLKPIIPSETSNLRVAPQALDLLHAESEKKSKGMMDDLKLPDFQLPISDMPEVKLVDNSRVVRGCFLTGLIMFLAIGTALVPVVYPLKSALKNRHFTYARVLMTLGADVNKRDDSGKTYLYHALMDKNYRLVRFLLDCDDTDTSDWTPLSLAVLMDDEVKARLLIQDGEDVTKKDSFGKIPLQWAIETECYDCLALLLEQHKKSCCSSPYNCLALLRMAEHDRKVSAAIRSMASRRLYELQEAEGGNMTFADAYLKGNADYVILYAAENEELAENELSQLELKALEDDVKGMQQILDNHKDAFSYRRKVLPGAVYWAAAAGNKKSLEFLLKEAEDKHVNLDYRLCPLTAAIRSGHEEIIELLLQSPRVDKNKEDDKGRNVIFAAVEQGNATILEKLIHSECNDLNSVDKDAVTPLHLAKQMGNDACVQLLEKAGYKTELDSYQAKKVLDGKGITWNSFASELENDDKIFKLMIKAGYNPNTVYIYNVYTPLTYAVLVNNVRLFDLLLSEPSVDVNLRDKSGRTPLTCAVEKNRKDMVKRLLKCERLNVRALNANSESALDIAIEDNMEDIVSLLLETEGIDINSTSANGKSKLERAFDYATLSIAAKLVDRGEKINYSISQKDGYIQKYVGNEKVLRFLLERGLQVNNTDQDGNTLLHLAAKGNCVESLKLLTACSGIELNKKNAFGETALLLAMEKNNAAAVEYLLSTPGIDVFETDSKGLNPLKYVIQKDDSSLLDKLLSSLAEIDVNRTDAEGNTLLHTAVNSKSKKCLNALLQISGINVNAKNHEGITPLMLAAKNNCGEMLSLLVKVKGMDFNVQDSAGRTALYHAAAAGHAEIVTALLKEDGINCDLADAQGYNPRSIAQQKKNYGCVKILRSHIDEIPDDYEKNIETYRREAEQNKSAAQFLLALCHYEGKGTQQNYAEAAKWFKKAAESHHSCAQYYWGLCYQNGYGVTMNEKEAAKWFEKAAEQEQNQAQYMLAMAYYQGKGKKKNPATAVRWFRAAAEGGCEESQYRMGVCYNTGEGVDRSKDEALFWFKKAAHQGHVKAQYNVGCYYYEQRDYDEAFVWFKKAADHNMPEALFNLGDCYYHGHGNIEKDYKKAFELYKAAAEQNYAPAQYNVGCCYYEGIGVDENENTAIQWFKKAAKNGHKAAKEFLK